MSIWSTVHVGQPSFDEHHHASYESDILDAIPYRNDYTGEEGEPSDSTTGSSVFAQTAVGWHDLIELGIDGGQFGAGQQAALMSVVEARMLIRVLEAAIARIGAAPTGHPPAVGAQENQP